MMATSHDGHLAHPAQAFPGGRRRLRHAVEVRHASFVDPGFIALLRKYGIGLVIADTAGKWPIQHDVTAGFIYLRLHGDKELYASGYSDVALKLWARRIRAWSQGEQLHRGSILTSAAMPPARKSRDVYCYFDNDLKVRAPFDAAALRKKLGS